MEQKSILPITPEDFNALEKKIGINQDQFCPICDGPLTTLSRGIFAAGIFYKCRYCEKTFKKTIFRDFRTQQDYFQLKESKGAV